MAIKKVMRIILPVGGGVFASAEAAGVTPSMTIASVILGLMWAWLVYECAFSGWIKKVGRYRNSVILGASLPIGFVFLGVGLLLSSLREANDSTSRPYDLSEPRRTQWLELLRKHQGPRDILKIGCIAWSDTSCVAAGRFLRLFSEAGWEIDSNRVYRLEPQIPSDGIAIVSRIDDNDDAEELPPHLGTWQEMTPSQITIANAFSQMGINVRFSSQRDMPLGTLGIFFGPEPEQR